jgi:membrane-associated phospholipid phosphatase
MFAGATLIAAERVYHDRHHASDVIVGALLGAAESTAAFFYQEHRFVSHSVTIVPVVTPETATVQLGWTF